MTDLSKIIISTLSVNVFYDARTRCSPSWKYFGHLVTKEDNKKRILNSEYVYCLACLDDVKKHSEDVIFGSIKIKRYNKSVSTGNLTRHLRDDHNIQEEPIRRIKPKKSKRSASSSNSDRYDKLELAKDLAAWFCKSLIPFDYFGGNGMMDFLKKYKIARDDNMPSRSIVSGSALSDLYESLLKYVEETISVDAAQHFSITFDLWTDLHREIKYISFTLHYLTSDFVLKSWHLTTERMNEKITARSLNEVIQKLKKRFNLNGKEVIAVTYSGKKIHQAVAKTNMTQHLCLGHGLHKLIIVDGINSIPEIIAVVKKCKRIVKTVGYRSSEIEVEAKQVQERQFLGSLDEVIENLEMDESDPIAQDDIISLKVDIDEAEIESNSSNHKPISKTKYVIPSRWHCLLEMLEFVINICNRETINFMLNRINQGILAISQHEWILLEELVKFLRCFRVAAVEILSCQETCTLNVALVFRSEIIDVLKSCQDKESKSMIDLKNNMMANIDRRFPVTKEIAAAALLDSRFMSLKEIDIFLEKNNMTRISFLSSYIKELIGAVDESGIEHNERKSNNNSLLHKLSKKHSINMNQGVQDDYIEQECWRYVTVADPSEPKDGDLLSFWNSKKNVFPNIAGLAKYLLCVPATVTPSERMFSVAGLTYTAKRSRLTPNLLNKIIFIHNNSPTLQV